MSKSSLSWASISTYCTNVIGSEKEAWTADLPSCVHLYPHNVVPQHGSFSWSLQHCWVWHLGMESGEQASCGDFLGPQVFGSTYHCDQAGLWPLELVCGRWAQALRPLPQLHYRQVVWLGARLGTGDPLELPLSHEHSLPREISPLKPPLRLCKPHCLPDHRRCSPHGPKAVDPELLTPSLTSPSPSSVAPLPLSLKSPALQGPLSWLDQC